MSGVDPGAIADGARWALVAVFALAAAEKAETLLHRAAAWHPVMLLGRVRRRHATALMATSLVLDVLALSLLIVLPLPGALISAGLVSAYTAAVRRLPEAAGGCRCLWRFFEVRTRQELMVRNLILGLLAGVVASSSPHAGLAGAISAVGILVVLVGATRAAARLSFGTGKHRISWSADDGDRGKPEQWALGHAAVPLPRPGHGVPDPPFPEDDPGSSAWAETPTHQPLSGRQETYDK